MLTYFIRRIAGGLVQLSMASLVIFYIVVELPGGPRDKLRDLAEDLARGPYGEAHEQIYIKRMGRVLLIDQPWPHNYLAWLFDPRKQIVYDLEGNPVAYPNSVNISIGNLQLIGAGVLTGDLGESMSVDPYWLVVDMFGPGIGEMFTFLTTLIAALIALVAAQRWRRPQPYRVSILPTASALVTWWHLNSRSPLDMAIMDRQWA